MREHDVEPRSSDELDALVALKRDARLRALRKTACGGGWASARVMALLDAAGLAFAYLVGVWAGTTWPFVFATIVAVVQLHDAVDARLKALIELLDVDRSGPAVERPGSAGTRPQS